MEALLKSDFYVIVSSSVSALVSTARPLEIKRDLFFLA
jgi:hypothetical protein